MSLLWGDLENKLNKSGRKWAESSDKLPYRYAELFCEECGVSLGMYDIVSTNLETMKYCGSCVKKYIKDTPIILTCGTIKTDFTFWYKGHLYLLTDTIRGGECSSIGDYNLTLLV